MQQHVVSSVIFVYRRTNAREEGHDCVCLSGDGRYVYGSYSEHCTQNIATNNTIQYKLPSLTTILKCLKAIYLKSMTFVIIYPDTYLDNSYSKYNISIHLYT